MQTNVIRLLMSWVLQSCPVATSRAIGTNGQQQHLSYGQLPLCWCTCAGTIVLYPSTATPGYNGILDGTECTCFSRFHCAETSPQEWLSSKWMLCNCRWRCQQWSCLLAAPPIRCLFLSGQTQHQTTKRLTRVPVAHVFIVIYQQL